MVSENGNSFFYGHGDISFHISLRRSLRGMSGFMVEENLEKYTDINRNSLGYPRKHKNQEM